MSVDQGVLRRLRQRYAGAPESLVRALREAAESDLPRLTRRELRAAADDVVPPLSSVVGQVRFPAVVPGGDDGCLYVAVASEVVRSDLTPVPPDLGRRVHDFAAQTWTRLSTRGLRLYLSGPGPGPTWSGRSCELALAVALVSAATGVRPRPWTVLTGTLEATGQTGAVGSLEEKRELVARDAGDGTLIEGGAAIDSVLEQALDPGWREVVRPRGARTARRVARRARAALDAHRYAEADELAADALDLQPGPSALAMAWWVRGAVALHQGRAADGLTALDAVLGALPAWTESETSPPEAWAREEIVAWFLVGLIDAGQIRAALSRGQATLDGMGTPSRRDARWRSVMVQLAGSTARAAVATGDLALAEHLLRTVSLGSAELDQERARCLGDLAEVYRKSGDRGRARSCLLEAREALLDMPAEARARTALFLDLYDARLGGPLVDPPPGVWPGRGFELVAAERASDLARIVALAEASADSAALLWVCVASAGVVADEVPTALRALLERWHTDDPSLDAIANAAASGDAAAMNELGSRCPY